MMKFDVKARSLVIAFAFVASSVPQAFAHGKEDHASKIGQKGEAAEVSRTVAVTMKDNSFELSSTAIKAGETVRFVVKNAGEFVHEFNIGNRDMHIAHREEMMTMMETGVLEVDRINHHMMGHGSSAMKHDDPNSVLLEPGGTGEIIWTFPESTKLQFACNVPGHYEDGMVGNFRY